MCLNEISIDLYTRKNLGWKILAHSDLEDHRHILFSRRCFAKFDPRRQCHKSHDRWTCYIGVVLSQVRLVNWRNSYRFQKDDTCVAVHFTRCYSQHFPDLSHCNYLEWHHHGWGCEEIFVVCVHVSLDLSVCWNALSCVPPTILGSQWVSEKTFASFASQKVSSICRKVLPFMATH